MLAWHDLVLAIRVKLINFNLQTFLFDPTRPVSHLLFFRLSSFIRLGLTILCSFWSKNFPFVNALLMPLLLAMIYTFVN